MVSKAKGRRVKRTYSSRYKMKQRADPGTSLKNLEKMKSAEVAKVLVALENVEYSGFVSLRDLKGLTDQSNQFRNAVGQLIRSKHAEIAKNRKGEVGIYPRLDEGAWKVLSEVTCVADEPVKIVIKKWKPIHQFRCIERIIGNATLYRSVKVRFHGKVKVRRLTEAVDRSWIGVQSVKERPQRADYIGDTIEDEDQNAMDLLVGAGKGAFVCLALTLANTIQADVEKKVELSLLNNMFWRITCPEDERNGPENKKPRMSLFPESWNNTAEPSERQYLNLEELGERFAAFHFGDEYITLKDDFCMIGQRELKDAAEKWYQDEIRSQKEQFEAAHASFLANQLFGLIQHNRPVKNKLELKPLLQREVSFMPYLRRRVRYSMKTDTWRRLRQQPIENIEQLAFDIEKWIEERAAVKNVFRKVILPRVDKSVIFQRVKDEWMKNRLQGLRRDADAAASIFLSAFEGHPEKLMVKIRLNQLVNAKTKEAEAQYKDEFPEQTPVHDYLCRALGLIIGRRDIDIESLYLRLPLEERRAISKARFLSETVKLIRLLGTARTEKHENKDFIHVQTSVSNLIREIQAKKPVDRWSNLWSSMKGNHAKRQPRTILLGKGETEGTTNAENSATAVETKARKRRAKENEEAELMQIASDEKKEWMPKRSRKECEVIEYKHFTCKHDGN